MVKKGGKWVQVNFPRTLIEKIDELLANGELMYANRNQFCTAILINEVNRIVELIQAREELNKKE